MVRVPAVGPLTALPQPTPYQWHSDPGGPSHPSLRTQVGPPVALYSATRAFRSLGATLSVSSIEPPCARGRIRSPSHSDIRIVIGGFLSVAVVGYLFRPASTGRRLVDQPPDLFSRTLP